jgi:hypothetical protein
MNRNQQIRALEQIIGQAESLTVKLPAARDHLLVELHHLDGMPGGSDAPKVQASSELTAVERAVAGRANVQARLKDLDDNLHAASLILRHLRSDCDKILGTRFEVPRCDGGVGYEGYMIPQADGGWSNPSCANVPSDGRKTCDQCRGRASTWKRRRGAAA